MRADGHHFMGSLHAAEHAAISLMPLLVVCDRGDIGGISIPLHPQTRTGAVFIYDGHPGGVGIAARGYRQLTELLTRVTDLLQECECDEGCPSCVQSPKCGNGNRPLDKGGALQLLSWLLGDQASGAPQEVHRIEIDLEPEKQPEDSQSSNGEGPDTEDYPRSSGSPPEQRPTESSGVGVVEPPRPDVSRSAVTRSGTVLFDLETQKSAADVGGWQNAHKMLVSVGVACFLEEGRLEAYREAELASLIEALETAELVVGFNIERFDYRVLSGYTGVDYGKRWPTLDLLQEIRQRLGFRLSLNHLAQETLGVEKSADGLQSLEWVKDGRLDLVEEYCRKDVEILRDLYLFGRRMGHVCYADRQGRKVKLPVDW